MTRRIETAVAAAATPMLRRQLSHLLACAGVALLAMPEDGPSALKALEDLHPDLLVSDAPLPFMEGAALIRRALCTPLLSVRPAAILLHDPAYPLPGRREIEDAGAVLVAKPVTDAAFVEAVCALRSSSIRFSAEETRRADRLLDALGVPSHRGRDCLRTAALVCLHDGRCKRSLSGMLYPRVGEMHALNAGQVERAMRHAIDLAWRSDKFDNQNRIFADSLDAGRGQPTCGEMIFRLADILRLEG